MKKTISLILAAVMLLTMLTACGGKAPAEPAETALYGKVTMENAPANALGAVVYLGYYESADAMKAEGWTFASHTCRWQRWAAEKPMPSFRGLKARA